ALAGQGRAADAVALCASLASGFLAGARTGLLSSGNGPGVSPWSPVSVLLDLAPTAADTPVALPEEKPLLAVVLPEPYGRLTVREEFDEDTGDAYFTVVKGGRCTGTFTIGTYTWGLVAVPTSVGVWYGRGGADTHNLERTDRPTVNGVRLSGG